MAGKPGHGGKKGRSGRLPIKEDVLRYLVRQKSYEVTNDYLNSKAKLNDKVKIGIQIVKTDMVKPIVIDQSKHARHTTINIAKMTSEELVGYLLGRGND